MQIPSSTPCGSTSEALPAFIRNPRRKRLLTAAELTLEYGFSTSTLAKLRLYGGGPPYVKLTQRGAVRYRREDVERWLGERVRTSTSDTIH